MPSSDEEKWSPCVERNLRSGSSVSRPELVRDPKALSAVACSCGGPDDALFQIDFGKKGSQTLRDIPQFDSQHTINIVAGSRPKRLR